MKRPLSMVGAALLAGGHSFHVPAWGSRIVKLSPSRTRCAACRCEIPPGKPGRKCAACRNITEPDMRRVEIPNHIHIEMPSRDAEI